MPQATNRDAGDEVVGRRWHRRGAGVLVSCASHHGRHPDGHARQEEGHGCRDLYVANIVSTEHSASMGIFKLIIRLSGAEASSLATPSPTTLSSVTTAPASN
jgi:hypothetical protein